MDKKIIEAATIRSRASSAARALREFLAEKTLPATLRQQVENVVAALRKTWADLESDAAVDDEQKESKLREAANVGEWLESRIHNIFTNLADDLFGEGKLTRDERIALSSAIGNALTAFNAVVVEKVPHLYERSPWQGPEQEATAVSEAGDFDGQVIPLVERSVRADGTIPVKIISPGWGSSGYYPADVLERDGPKVFTPGLKMYWNHQTPSEEAERPEGDLNDLAAELVTGARWDAGGAAGPGLYAEAKVFEQFRSAVDDLGPHIGVSIRASGKARPGQAEGKNGAIIQQLLNSRSVDFVTLPGAGGQIVQLFESARRGGAAVSPAPTIQSVESERSFQMTEAEIKAMQAENERLTTEVAALKKTVEEKTTAAEKAATEAARMREVKLLSDAKAHVETALGKVGGLPAATRTRLSEALRKQAVAKDDGGLDIEKFDGMIQEAVKAEVAYLAEAAGLGNIQGMGSMGAGSSTPQAQDATVLMEEAFRSIGLTESAAKQAAKGR